MEPGRQFDSVARVAGYKTAKTIPGTKVAFGRDSDRYKPNPFAAHITPPVIEHFDDGSTMNHPTHGIPGYDATASVVRPRRVESIPLDRLESTQREVSANHTRNMGKRKGQAPPIEVTHHTEADRYVISEGNHRATTALLRGDTHIRAEVTRVTPWRG